jgi:uracil phosphoribosyltransferase
MAAAESDHILQSRALAPLFTVIRDASTPHAAFSTHARRLMRLLAEEGIASLPASAEMVATPCGTFAGARLPDASDVCAVSIVRAGDALLEEVRAVWPAVSVGKLLIQRDEATALPLLFYEKLPPNVAGKHVLLCDPMLATGGSAVMAIARLVERGVQPSRIIFPNVLACPEGIAHVHGAFPDVQIVTCAIDERLDERKYIVPGLGDYGDRFYGTSDH